MNNISIIGSDSFIATQFYNSLENKQSVKLFSRKESGKEEEIVKDLFEIEIDDFKGVDVVLNFAAIVHQPKLKDDELYKKVNTDLPILLAQKAQKAGVKHFVQMSTIAVYGNATSINVNTHERPINIYGKTKLEADKALLALQDATFKVSILRPPMVYGGGLAPGNLQSLIKFSQKGFPMPFKGVDNKRDFIHVGNLVEALNFVISNKINGVVIPTDRQAVSTEEIINIIKKYSTGKIIQIKIPGFIHALIKKLSPSIYSKVFGNLEVECNLSTECYKPILTIEDGIKEMIKALKK